QSEDVANRRDIGHEGNECRWCPYIKHVRISHDCRNWSSTATLNKDLTSTASCTAVDGQVGSELSSIGRHCGGTVKGDVVRRDDLHRLCTSKSDAEDRQIKRGGAGCTRHWRA